MDYELLETFVVLCETKSITRTSELMYKTQPAISGRIRQLEDLLGYTLVLREKGKKSVRITPRGLAFLKTAQKLTALYGEIETCEKQMSDTLFISSITSLSSSIVAPVCRRLINEDHLRIILETYQTADACRLVADKITDIAFVSSISSVNAVNGVRCEEAATLEFSVIKYCETPGPEGTLSSADLNPALEIYQRWSSAYQIWHDRRFGEDKYQVEVDSVNLLKDFMKGTDCWSIVQDCNLPDLKKQMPIQTYKLLDPPPPRIAYMLTNQFPDRSIQHALTRFREVLRDETAVQTHR